MKKFATTKAISLTELLIVVTLIAILMAIATPGYRAYIVRSKLKAGLDLASEVKSRVLRHYYKTGLFPCGLVEGACTSVDSGFAIADWTNLSDDVNSLKFVRDASTSDYGAGVSSAFGTIEVQYGSNVVPGVTSPKLGLIATLGGNGESIQWACLTHVSTAASAIPERYLPSECGAP